MDSAPADNGAMSTEPEDDFDAEGHVKAFRKAMAELEAQTTAAGRTKAQRTVDRLRKEWKDWQGEDSLFEMAFGEPE